MTFSAVDDDQCEFCELPEPHSRLPRKAPTCHAEQAGTEQAPIVLTIELEICEATEHECSEFVDVELVDMERVPGLRALGMSWAVHLAVWRRADERSVVRKHSDDFVKEATDFVDVLDGL